MTEAPERIWLWTERDGRVLQEQEYYDEPNHSDLFGPSIPYIRADLVPEWQPIETAPKDGTPIIVGYDGRNGGEVWSHAAAWVMLYEEGGEPLGEEWHYPTGFEPEHGQPYHPTHWQPLPAPPAP